MMFDFIGIKLFRFHDQHTASPPKVAEKEINQQGALLF
jgi:hypothetical protein